MPDNIVPIVPHEETMSGNDLLLPTSTEETTHRPKKKHIYDQILKQLEFYLGDANLSKDRFLSQKLQESPRKYACTYNKYCSVT
jgi:hypothetical protein